MIAAQRTASRKELLIEIITRLETFPDEYLAGLLEGFELHPPLPGCDDGQESFGYPLVLVHPPE